MESKKRTITKTFRFSADMVDKIKELAKQENRSMNNYLETILNKHLEQQEHDKINDNKGLSKRST